MDLSEQEASALYSVDAEERQWARFAWLARRDEVLNEWKRYLIGKRFLEHQDRDRGGNAGDHASKHFLPSDLPRNYRLIFPSTSCIDRDRCIERLNIYLDDDSVVNHLRWG